MWQYNKGFLIKWKTNEGFVSIVIKSGWVCFTTIKQFIKNTV